MTPPFSTARTRSQFGDQPHSSQQQRCKLCIQKVKFNSRCLIRLSFPGASRNCPSSTHLQSEEKHWQRSLGLTEVLQEWHNAWVWLAAQPQQPDTNPHLSIHACPATDSSCNLAHRACTCLLELQPAPCLQVKCHLAATPFSAGKSQHAAGSPKPPVQGQAMLLPDGNRLCLGAAGPNRTSPPQPHHPLLHFCTQLNNNKKARTCFG